MKTKSQKSRIVKTHTLNHVKRNIDVEAFDGICILPNSKPSIHISAGLPYSEHKGARKGLVTILEESLHAELPNKSEKVINRIAGEIGGLLWRLGYRRIER